MKTINQEHIKFRKKAKNQIDEIFDELDRLREKKAKVESHTKEEYEKRIKELEARKHELKSRFQDLATASDEKWNEAIEAWESSKEDFKAGFDKLKAVVE